MKFSIFEYETFYVRPIFQPTFILHICNTQRRLKQILHNIRGLNEKLRSEINLLLKSSFIKIRMSMPTFSYAGRGNNFSLVLHIRVLLLYAVGGRKFFMYNSTTHISGRFLRTWRSEERLET